MGKPSSESYGGRKCWGSARERNRMQARYNIHQRIFHHNNNYSASSKTENASPNIGLIKEIVHRIIQGDRSYISLHFMEENYVTLNEPFSTQYLWLDDNRELLLGEEKLTSWFKKEGVDAMKRYLSDLANCSFMEYAVWLKRYHVVSSLILGGINPCSNGQYQNEMQSRSCHEIKDVSIAAQQRFGSGVVPLSLSSYMVQRVVTLRRCAWERSRKDDETSHKYCSICMLKLRPEHQLIIEERCNANPDKHILCELCLWNDLLENMFQRSEDVVVCPACHRNDCPTNGLVIDAPLRREQRMKEALEKFLILPADSNVIKFSERKKHVVAERESLCSTWSEAVKPSIGMTQTSRRDKFFMYVERNESFAFVKGCLDEGIDVLMQNEYGQTALFIAVWRCNARLVQLLLNYGSDPNILSNGGISCLSLAITKGMCDIEDLLKQAGATENTSHSFWKEDVWQEHCLKSSLPFQMEVLIPCESGHPGAGSFFVDDCFQERFIEKLVELWKSLPTALDREKKNGPCSIRSYFCDTEDWICKGLGHIISAVFSSASEDQCMEGYRFISVLPRMRFLCYAECGTLLSPHVDLCRTDTVSSHRSTHTFLLYLTDCFHGGETALLKDVAGEGRNIVLASVKPKRGRLLVFPHLCPHEGLTVVDVPKLIVRGEVVIAKGFL